MTGYYNRCDVFDLRLTRARQVPVRFIDHPLPEQPPLDDPGQGV